MIVGLGAGYVEAEFAAAGVPLAERAGRMDDGIRALRALWTMELRTTSGATAPRTTRKPPAQSSSMDAVISLIDSAVGLKQAADRTRI